MSPANVALLLSTLDTGLQHAVTIMPDGLLFLFIDGRVRVH